MLDIKFVRDNLEKVQTALQNRHSKMNLSGFKELEKKRRTILGEVEVLKNQRNTVSKQISEMKKNKENADNLVGEMRKVGEQISAFDNDLKEVEMGLREIMLNIPNVPNDDVPVGKDENDNPEVRKWGEPKQYDFIPKPHWEIGEDLD
ncbi:MAG: serine--tRNA ligase, partial [Selenomonadaceae bacterium]